MTTMTDTERRSAAPTPRAELAELLAGRHGWQPAPGGRFLRRSMLSGSSLTDTRWALVEARVRPAGAGFEVELVRRWTNGGWGNQYGRVIGRHQAEDALAAVLTSEGQMAAVTRYDSGSTAPAR